MTHRRWHPFDVVTRILAERLRGRETSHQLCAMVQAQDVDWEGVVGHASRHFVLPALAAALRDLGLAGSLERELAEFLAAVHGASVERNTELRDQLADVARTLNQAGIEPVLLKGAIRLVDGLYPNPGWRLMRDLDVLVPEGAFMTAIGALRDAGYRSVGEADPARKDLKLRGEGLASVEVHKDLFWTARKQQLLGGADVIAHSLPHALHGARVRLPCAEHQITHLIGHSQIGHFNHLYGRIALRDRLEAAALARWVLDDSQWHAIYLRFAAAGYSRPLVAFLLALRDGGLFEPQRRNGAGALAALQAWRIALQARSPALTRISLFLGWYVVLFQLHILDREAGWPGLGQRLAKLLRYPTERRRVARILVRGPNPW